MLYPSVHPSLRNRQAGGGRGGKKKRTDKRRFPIFLFPRKKKGGGENAHCCGEKKSWIPQKYIFRVSQKKAPLVPIKILFLFFCSSHMEQQRHSEHPLNSQMTILEEERGKDKGSHSSSSFLCPPPLSVSNLSGKSEEEEEEERD